MKLKDLVYYLLGWRLALFLIAVVAGFLIPFKDSFPYREVLLVPYRWPWLYSWGNFDGVHYLGIAAQGYFAGFTQAFFPLYPLVVRFVNIFIQNLLVSGMLVSWLSLVVAVWYLYKLICLDYPQSVAKQTLVFLLIFPTAFYFAAVYSESFFLALVVTSFYSMRTKHPRRAILLAALASATRIVGVFLLPALIWEKYQQLSKVSKKEAKKITHYIPYLAAGAGLLAYMVYLQNQFHDALYFLHAQPAFGAGRSDKIILLYQVIYRYVKMLLTVDYKSLLFYTVFQEFAISMIFLGLLIFAIKKVRLSYLIFAFAAFVLPTLTGTFSSMPRYTLVLFPAFIVLGTIKDKRVVYTLYAISTILLIINTILFTRGYWVA